MRTFWRMCAHVRHANVLLSNSVYFRSIWCFFIAEHYHSWLYVADCKHIFYQIYKQILSKDLFTNATLHSISLISGSRPILE